MIGIGVGEEREFGPLNALDENRLVVVLLHQHRQFVDPLFFGDAEQQPRFFHRRHEIRHALLPTHRRVRRRVHCVPSSDYFGVVKLDSSGQAARRGSHRSELDLPQRGKAPVSKSNRSSTRPTV